MKWSMVEERRLEAARQAWRAAGRPSFGPEHAAFHAALVAWDMACEEGGQVNTVVARPEPTVFGPSTVRCPYGWQYTTRYDRETQTYRPVFDGAHPQAGEYVVVCDCVRCTSTRRRNQ